MLHRFSSVLSAVAVLVLVGAAPMPSHRASQRSPRPGWQVLQDHSSAPDLLRVGVYGERYRSPTVAPTSPTGMASQPGSSGAQPAAPSRVPRLMASCENGTTSLTLTLAIEEIDHSRFRIDDGRDNNLDDNFGNGQVVLMFDDGSRVKIDLRAYSRRNELIYLTEPFDRIQRLLSAESLYFWEVRRGRQVAVGWEDWTVEPDVVFRVGGLRGLLDSTRDPCGWGA